MPGAAGAPRLRLRPLRPCDEVPAIAAHHAFSAENFTFLLDYSAGEPWAAYLERLSDLARAVRVPRDRVPSAFLVAVVDGTIVGRVSVRDELRASLAVTGGHIGYGVLAEHRRQGYATLMLRQALVVARARGVDDVLVTCDDDNAGSIRVIERCGGVLEGLVETPGAPRRTRRYWIR